MGLDTLTRKEKLIEIFDENLLEKYENKVKRFIVFKNNENFLKTEFSPLNNDVYLIVECENGTQLNFKDCNCGYYGTGPRRTVKILTQLGLNKEILEQYIFKYSGAEFYIENNEIVNIIIDNIEIFEETSCKIFNNKKLNTYHSDKICKSRNCKVDFKNKEIYFFNPQRNFWVGFIRLISSMNIKAIEYYVGDNSPIGNYMTVDNIFLNINKLYRDVDLVGTKQVSLALYSERYKIYCFIDEKEVKRVIDSVLLMYRKDGIFKEDCRFIKKRIKNIFAKEAYRHDIVGVHDD